MHAFLKLRAKFWILKRRAAIRESLSKCMKCRRYKARDYKPFHLRYQKIVRDANAFEIVGVDLAYSVRFSRCVNFGA